jgi:hypothetical protein
MSTSSLPQPRFEKHWPNQTFFHWLRSQTSLFIGQILTLIALPSTIIALIYYTTNNHALPHITPELLSNIIVLLHLPFMLMFIIKLMLILDENDIGEYRSEVVYKCVFRQTMKPDALIENLDNSKMRMRQFKKYFLFFLFSLLLLYIAFSASIPQGKKHTEEMGEYKMKIQAILSGKSMTLLPDTITFDTPLAIKPNHILYPVNFFYTSSGFEAFEHIHKEFWPLLFNNIGCLFIFLCFTLLYNPKSNTKDKRTLQKVRRIAILFICLFTAAFPFFLLINIRGEYSHNYLIGYATFFNALSGVINALVLALLIGRLDSKLIGLPSHLVSILYIYASVQPLFVVFSLPGIVHEVIKTGVFILVFAFKVYFFFIIIYAFQTGRLLNYFFCFPELELRVNSIFKNQFEISIHKDHDAHSFNFSITRGEEMIYVSDHTFDKRKICLNTVKRLRHIMKTEKSFKIKEYGGTYWVEVSEVKEGKVIIYCICKNLKSRKEAEDMIEQSMEKMPYCKLNYT